MAISAPFGGSGTISVVTKGPLTDGAAASQANGFLGAYMRTNGYDGVVVQGAAESLQYLYIHDGQAELRDAGHLAGVDTWDMIDRLAEELGVDERRISVFGIGPAGENRVRFAAIAGDRGHVAGHNGTGAVMGSKRLKAIRFWLINLPGRVARGARQLVIRLVGGHPSNETLFRARERMASLYDTS